MAHRSQCSSAGDNPLDPNYLPRHYREEYRMAIDALIDADLEGYYGFLQEADVVDFLSHSEIEYIKCMVKAPHQHTAQPEKRYMAEDADGSSDTYWPVHSDHDAPSLELGWPEQYRFVGPTEVTTLVNPPEPEMPSIKEQVRRLIKSAQQVVAVVMDMFTDVDIFADILGAAMRGVAVYILLDELNAHHFVAMVNNCRVNLDEIKFMRVRTVSGSTYFCRTGKSFKGQMMDRFILVDCRAVLSGNYSFMWSFEKIHRCLAHMFLGQLVATFDEEFRILFAHSEPLVVENVLANIPHYSSEQGSYRNTDKTHMLKKEYPTVDMERTEYPADGHMNAGHKMLPFRRGESINTAVEENPSVQRHVNLYATQQFHGDHQFIEHGRQIKGPTNIASFKGRGYADVPNYEYMPPQNHATVKGKQYKEGVVTQGTHFAREPCFYQQGTGLQPGYDMYGRIRGQGYHVDQFSGSGYPHEGDEAGPPGDYDHVQRYLQSHSPMEEGHDDRNLLPPVKSNLRRHNKGQSYACQTSPTQPNLPDQKHFFNVNHKPQDVSQKQGLRDWRISSYLSAYDDAGEADLSELEGSDSCDNVPYFKQEGPVGAKIRPGNREFNRIPSSRENPAFLQIQNTSALLDSSVNHPADISQINIKTTPTTTSESSCNIEGGKVEETQNSEPKETSLIIEEFHRKKPTRTVQSSRLRYSQIFNSNLELNTSEMKDTLGEKDGDETSKPSAHVLHWLDKRRASTREPFQWSSFARPATVDNPVMESAHSVEVLNKVGANSDVDNVENSQNSQTKTIKGPLQEKELPEKVQSAVLEGNSQSSEWGSKVFQRSTSFIDMNDPECRLRYFKELAAKRKAELTGAKASQSNLGKSPQKSDAPEKLFTRNTVKKAEHVFKTPATLDKSSNATLRAPEKQETLDNPECGKSSEELSHRATDAEKIRLKKKIAEESVSSTPVLNTCIQKHVCDLSADPIATKSVHSQKTLAVGADSSQHCPTTDEKSSQQPTAAESESFQQLTGTGPDSSQYSTATQCGHSQKPTAISADSFKPRTAMGADSFQQPNAAESKHSTAIGTDPTTTGNELPQAPTATGPDSSKDSPRMGADSFQQPTATYTDTSQHPTVTDTISFDHPTASNTDSFQQYTAIGTESSQQHTVTDTDSSQYPNATDRNSSQHPAAIDTDCSQHPSSTNTDSSQQATATETDSSQQATATDTDAPQQPTETESVHSQNPTAMSADIFKQQTTMGAYSFQQPNVVESKFSQQSTATDTDTSQHPILTGTNYTDNPTATDTDSSQQPNATNTVSLHHPTSKDTESSQHHTEIDLDCSQHPTAIDTDSSQQPTATNTDSSQHPTATDTDFSQQAIVTDTDYSQQPPITDTDSSQHSTATDTSQQCIAKDTDSSQHHTAIVTNSSQHPAATGTDSSQHPTATDASQQCIAKDTDSSQHHTAIGTDSSQHPHATDTDSSQHPSATDIDPSQNAKGTGHKLILTGSGSTSILETNSEKIVLTPVACTIQNAEVKSPEHGPADNSASSLEITLPIDTTSSETSLPQEHRSPNMNEQKDNRVCQVLSKQGPIPAANITQTDSSVSLNTVITDLGSAEHSQSDSLAPCASLESSLILNSDIAKPGPQSDDNQMVRNSSPIQSQAQAKSPIPPVIKDTNSCENDPKPEKYKDECQNNEIIDEQPQRHDTSARPTGHEKSEVSTAQDPIQVNRTKNTTPETENSETNFAEVSAISKRDLIVHSDVENQSSVTEKPKSILPTHQSSTANLLAFSNLRDDTKVLLEQISAKNQSRGSQSKQTFETKEGAINSADIHSGRPWSSKATAEDRAKLLQKMDVLRKERKVYSRFEAT